MEFHDAVFALVAPFKDVPKELFKTALRYRGTTWGDASVTLVNEGLRSNKR